MSTPIKDISYKTVFFDTETNSKTNPHAVQIVAIDVTNTVEHNEYYQPPQSHPIDYHAMAIHHLTNDFISDFPAIDDDERQYLSDTFFTDSFIVAHNINFDLEVLKNDMIPVESCRIIDTLKISKILLEDAEAYNLQYLRYFLDIQDQFEAHDAYDDVLLLIAIFNRLYDRYIKRESIEDNTESKQIFLYWAHEATITPLEIKKFTF